MDNPMNNTQQNTLHDQDYYQQLEEERWHINHERCAAITQRFKERFNVDDYMALQLAIAESYAAEDPEDEEAVEWAKDLRDDIPTMTLDDKLFFLSRSMYTESSETCEELLRSLNIVTPYETQVYLGYSEEPNQKMIERAVSIHKENLKNGTETKKLGFRRKGGLYHLNEEQEKYVRTIQLVIASVEGEEGSIRLLQLVYDNEWYPYLEPDQYEQIKGFSWDTINMDDYRAGHLLTYGNALPFGAFSPMYDRIEFLADLAKRGEIDAPTFWKRVENSSYVSGLEQFGPDGEQALLITKKNWHRFVTSRDKVPNYELEPSTRSSQFPEALKGDSYEETMERTYNWCMADWEVWSDSLPDDWYVVNTDAVQTVLKEYESEILPAEIVLQCGMEWMRRLGN